MAEGRSPLKEGKVVETDDEYSYKSSEFALLENLELVVNVNLAYSKTLQFLGAEVYFRTVDRHLLNKSIIFTVIISIYLKRVIMKLY